jgi:hypothetical protein
MQYWITMPYAYFDGAHLKRLIAWFKRKTRGPVPQARKPSAAWGNSASIPEIAIPDTSDDFAPQQDSVSQSFAQDESWQPPACEAPSFDTSASFSAPSACDPPSYTDP